MMLLDLITTMQERSKEEANLRAQDKAVIGANNNRKINIILIHNKVREMIIENGKMNKVKEQMISIRSIRRHGRTIIMDKKTILINKTSKISSNSRKNKKERQKTSINRNNIKSIKDTETIKTTGKINNNNTNNLTINLKNHTKKIIQITIIQIKRKKQSKNNIMISIGKTLINKETTKIKQMKMPVNGRSTKGINKKKNMDRIIRNRKGGDNNGRNSIVGIRKWY